MGMAGWLHWLSDEISKWKALLEMTKDPEEIAFIKAHIAELEKKLGE